ncbi:Sn1-specific diacylglycerol lipase alpha [Tanacetum coccineum]
MEGGSFWILRRNECFIPKTTTGLLDFGLGGSLKWELPTVNRQPSTWECGYYVMRWMHDFVLKYQNDDFLNIIPWGEERLLENKELDAVIGAWIRWWRMSGYNTLWFPGMDNEGIAIQARLVTTYILRGLYFGSSSDQESGKHVIATIINGSDLVPTFSTASIDDLRTEITASSWLNYLHDQVEQTRVLNVVFRSATSLGSRLPSMANARAKVTGACAMLCPISSSTQLEGKTLRMKDNKYAFKAVKAAGVTSIRVRGKDAVCVVTQKKVPSSADAGQAFGFNQCYTSVRVTKFVGLLAIGTTVFMTILSDARTLVQQARNEAAEFRFKYGYEMHVEVLARRFMFQVIYESVRVKELQSKLLKLLLELERASLLLLHLFLAVVKQV